MPRFDPVVHTLTLLHAVGELDSARRADDSPTDRPPRSLEFTVAYLHGDKAWLRSIARGAPCFALADEPGVVGVGTAAVVFGADVPSVVALARTVAAAIVVVVLPRDADPSAAVAFAQEVTGKTARVTQLPRPGEYSEVRVVTDNAGQVSVHVAPLVEPAPKAEQRRPRRRAQAADEASLSDSTVSGVALRAGLDAQGNEITPEALASLAATFTPAEPAPTPQVNAEPSDEPQAHADAEPAP